MKKRTKVIILAAMVALLGVTAYLNIALNNRVVETSNQEYQYAGYFTSYRSDRQTTRDQELLYYDAIISSESSSAEVIANAEAKKMEIISKMESELIMEGMIKSKGFEDAVVAISNNNVNVIIKTAKLESNEVAQIVSIIKEQTGKGIDNIVITPVE